MSVTTVFVVKNVCYILLTKSLMWLSCVTLTNVSCLEIQNMLI